MRIFFFKIKIITFLKSKAANSKVSLNNPSIVIESIGLSSNEVYLSCSNLPSAGPTAGCNICDNRWELCELISFDKLDSISSY